MKIEKAYCSGCGHLVRMGVTDAPPTGGQATLSDGAELVCLDYQEGCAGGRCPNTGRPGIVMGVRLAKSHLNDEAFTSIYARCDACGGVSDLEVLSETYALCTLCDSTVQWVMMKLDDGERIVLTG